MIEQIGGRSMIRFYDRKTRPGGGVIDWQAGAMKCRLRVDVPDTSGVWPEGRLLLLEGGWGGSLHLRVEPTGEDPSRNIVVVFLVGYEFVVRPGNDENLPHQEARILATGFSVARRDAGMLVAAELQDDEFLVVQETPYKGRGNLSYWVFSQDGAQRLSFGEAKALLCPKEVTIL